MWAYVSQFYVTIIGILLMPIYLHSLGAEAFGLVGFFLMAQAWMQVFDMGLTPVLSREMSRFRAGTISSEEAACRLITLEGIQGTLALTVAVLIWVGSDQIAKNWLTAQGLSENTVSECVALMGGAIALRWLAGLHRGVLVGLEQQYIVNALAAAFATFRFVGVVPLLLYVSTTPEYFFSFQMIVSAVELVATIWFAHHFIPGGAMRWPDLRVLRGMLPMVGSMAFLSAMWIMLTQIDKLVLSGILSLQEYGYFTLAVIAASGVLILIPPLNQVVQPRLTILSERGEAESFRMLYSLVSQLSVIGFVGLGAWLGFFSESILKVWTGSGEIAKATAPILLWYGLANAAVGVLVTPFMMQFAKGKLKLHVAGNLLMLATLVPALLVATQHNGAVGAGQVFFGANLLFFLLWMPLVHHRFMPEIVWAWLFSDTLPVAFVVAGILWLAAQCMPDGLSASVALIWACFSILMALACGLISGRHSRRFVFHLLILGRK